MDKKNTQPNNRLKNTHNSTAPHFLYS